MLAILIMAAGQASRFGACKQLVEYQGKPLLQHAIEKAQALNPNHVYVISGAWHDELVQAQRQCVIDDVPLLLNSNWQQGLGNSIAFGVSQLAPRYSFVMVLLADQVALTTQDLQRLLQHYDEEQIVCGFYAGKRGVPAIFPQSYFYKLRQLSGELGAKALLASDNVIPCALPNARLDIDTIQDLEQLNPSCLN